MTKTTREVMAELFEEATPPEEVETLAAEVVEPEEGAHEEDGEASGEEDGGEETAAAGDEGAAGERKRGPDGKFVKAAAEKPKLDARAAKVAAAAKPVVVVKPGAAVKPGEQQQQQQQPTALKAPADWKPAAREEFAKLPRIVQEEAIRLHLETKKTLQDSAQSRQVADAFQRTVAPYEQLFRASGRQPIEGVNYLLQTYQALNSAPLPQRAQIIGGLIRDYLGTDDNGIGLLAQMLDGKATPAGGGTPAPAAIRPEQIPQLVRQEAQRMQAEQQTQAEFKAISDFETQAPEFLNDVTQEMTALITIEKRQGKSITKEVLQAAYEKALRINSQTAAILKQRDDAAAAKKLQGDKGKRAAAASGLRNEPGGPASGGAKAKTTREQLQQEYDRASQSGRV